MKSVLPALVVCFSAVVLAEEIPRAAMVTEPPANAADTPVVAQDTVISWTKQFRISDGTSLVRGTVAMMAEETKTDLLKLTGEKDEWKVPIVIRLHGKQGDPLPPRTVKLGLLEVAGVSELKIDVHLSRGIENEPFKRAVTAALLYERALRKGPVADPDHALFIPPWLSDGLREATAWRLNQSDRRLYEAIFKSGLFKIDELLGTDEAEFEDMDAATRAAFRVSSGSLVMALLEQPQGKDGFRTFLTEAAAYEGEMPALLRKHFPEMNLSETSLAKWWALQLAAKGGTNLLTDTLTIHKSEAALTAALQLNFRNAEGIVQQKPLDAWPETASLKEPERIAAVRVAQDALVRLSYRCFPSYRPLLVEYQLVLDAIAKNKTKNVGERLASLMETRKTMTARATRARDYLDWFEITRARETSGEFEDYLKLKERLKSNPHPRKDDISTYLDRMNRIFNREEKKSAFRPPP
ncbi:MAG: hypothetical protein WCS43_14365 [Verrucomicrobiota bacterium]